MIYDILRMGDPRLLRIAEPIKKLNTPELRMLVADMFETMHSVGGAGLAAPQIGVNLRLVIFGFEKLERYPDAPPVPPTVLVNPTWTTHGDEMVGGWEGCLSVPGMRGWVERASALTYSGFTADGKKVERTVNGFHARVVQHECDHLDGKLYPMRIADFSKFGFTEELFPDGNGPVDD